MTQPLWRPSAEHIASTRMDAFRQFVNQRHALQLPDYPALHAWSIEQRRDFWQAIADFFEVHWQQPASYVLHEGAEMPIADWFVDGTLNFAEHLLRRRDNATALVAVSENGARKTLSYAELAAHVAGLQRYLQAQGVGVGDRVAAIMPNTWQTVVGMLATASLGATWSSCSPDFGSHGIVDRFGQIEPKVLIACAGYHYAGKVIDIRSKLQDVLNQLPSVHCVVLVPYAIPEASAAEISPLCTRWQDDFTPGGKPHFTPVPFAQPLYILYSSGTTGVPKCIVHGVGGTLLQHLKELGLHSDVKADDTLFYYSTCGWMMWNWLVSGLALGSTLVLYDGSPFHPTPERLIDLIDAEQISHFGVSAKYLAALEKAGVVPNASHQLSKLRAVFSTGSPLAHEGFDYVYQSFKSDLCLASISGGTDIVSCFALGNPVLPVWRGQLQCAGLGMAVEVWNDDGKPVRGEKGELVCTRHFPSMPVGFWNDDEGTKFHAAYFERFPGVWAHGDYAEITPEGGLIIHGRSDAVLNPGGVRIGTAEIYRQVEKVEAVLESLAIGQEWQGDVRVVLFVRLRDGLVLDDALQDTLRQQIRTNTTPRHVPAKIVQVTDIPRTLSGKIVELAVRNVVHNLPVKNTDALANPEALAQFRNRAELAD
ncbi:acetoacetyl-CoA synthetase [Atopomonas hussainii]|uniref:Acetoacetyl-CoA synthetase n=1 Tax=Atopomonas hussainii TaxID=1429083 RepID=A0A1H7TDC9_9GAMM|nr:acetoacetate--CoA ligase [Atopomonas hussainii]SEL81837.1 acetoacetyl-CoA synthetase [Atopomonas hussainii]